MTKYYQKKYLTMLVLLLSMMVHSAWAQTIKGEITDTNKNPLIGASVVEKGTTNGSITDFNGQFNLNLSDGANSVLVISFVGYIDQEIKVGNQSNFNVILQEDIAELEELVVIGYGTQKKKNISGAIAAVDAKALEGRPVADFANALQGQIAGLQVVGESGQPGEETTIRVRGTGTINGGSNPLIVIDNVIMTNGQGISSINPADIESVNVLKDASAAAIYGARAANGVIIVTTKRGRASDAPTVGFNFFAGVQSASKKLDMLNSEQYRDVMNAARDNAGMPRIPNLDKPLQHDTDWQDAVLRPAAINNYEVTFSGGNAKTRYFGSVNHYDEGGIIMNSGFKRTSARLNTDTQLGRLKIGTSMFYSQNNRDNQFASGGDLGALRWALASSPNVEIYNPNNLGGFNGHQIDDGDREMLNPVAAQTLVEDTRQINRFLANAFAEIEIIEGLTYRLNAGADISNTHDRMWAPEFDQGNGVMPPGLPFGAQLDEQRSNYQALLLENTLNFKRKIGKHDFGLLAGHSVQNTASAFQSISVIGGNLSPEYPVIDGSPNINGIPKGNIFETRTISYLGRAIYDYDSKYLATVNFRRDGSSMFKKGNMFDNFFSASAGWNISNEDFFNVQEINELKLRGSWGFLGNDQIDANATRSVVNNNPRYVFNGGELAQGVAPSPQIGNPNLVWEKQEQMNVGVDLLAFNNKLSFTADYFVKTSRDLLLSYSLPEATGFGNMFLNAAAVQNRGWEFATNYNTKVGAVNLNIGGNITFLKNEVLELIDGLEAIERNRSSHFTFRNRIEPGQSLFAIYGFKHDGIYQSQDEIDAGPTPLEGNPTKPGDVRYVDVNGDGKITDEDRTFIGDGNQDIMYGFNFGGNYKNLDFGLQFQGVYGNEVFNESSYEYSGYVRSFNMTTDVLDAWTPTNPSNTRHRHIPATEANNKVASSYWVEDASYLRLKNVQIGYTFNEHQLNKISWLKGLRVYVSAQNLFTISDYSGYDPAVVFGAVSSQLLYPTPRSFVGGVNIKF